MSNGPFKLKKSLKHQNHGMLTNKSPPNNYQLANYSKLNKDVVQSDLTLLSA